MKKKIIMKRTLFSNNGGLGIILNSEEPEQNFFIASSFLLCNETLSPNDYTTLGGMFEKPVRYVGALASDPKCMAFHLGDDGDLFGTAKYYSCFYWITPERIFNMYSPNAGRDFNWIGGRWK